MILRSPLQEANMESSKKARKTLRRDILKRWISGQLGRKIQNPCFLSFEAIRADARYLGIIYVNLTER